MSSKTSSHAVRCIAVFALVTLSCTFAQSKESKSWNLLRKKVASNYAASSVAKLKEADKGHQRQGSTPSSYGVDGDKSYFDIYTLVAASAFSALFGILFFELAAGTTSRSLEGPLVNNPLESGPLPQLVSKITEWISNSAWLDKIAEGKSRTLRDVTKHIGLTKWIQAYKRDPIQYQCIRKFACETLAESKLIARSMKSPFGTTFLATVGSFMEHGEELQSIVQNTLANPDRCREMAPWGFCDGDGPPKKITY